MFYQTSIFCAAFCQMLAAKGYSTSDADVNVLAAVLANVITDADLEPNVMVVGYSPTPTFNAADANGFQMTLAGNITASSIAGVSPGQLIAFYFAQDATGGRTVSWPSGFVGALQPDPASNAVSVQMFRADLSSVPRAVTDMVSNNGIFTGAVNAASLTAAGLVKAGSLTLASPGTTGQVLTNVGGVFLPTTYASSSPTMNAATGNVAGINTAGLTYICPSNAWLTVIVTGQLTGGVGHSGSWQATVNGVVVNRNGVTNSSGAASVTFEVPPSGSYSVRTGGVAPGDDSYLAQTSWIEYSHPL
jgi:hypothetical protein